MPPEPDRRERARLSLEGLSVGDAFGERFFVHPQKVERLIEERALPAGPPWRYTDDTEMALGILEVLEAGGRVDQDALAAAFGRRYLANPVRGYGGTAHQILQEIGSGVPWRLASRAAFGGQGSMGNGSAMRVAPLGAWFADDVGAAVREATLSAQVTHLNPEGVAGAVAIAVAAAWAWRSRGVPFERAAFFDAVLASTPSSKLKPRIEAAQALPPETPVRRAVAELGNGSRVLCGDTVPLCLWCIARHPDSYEEALWTTVAARGDRDTTCAIVGGVVVLRTGIEGIPAEWLRSREPLGLGPAAR